MKFSKLLNYMSVVTHNGVESKAISEIGCYGDKHSRNKKLIKALNSSLGSFASSMALSCDNFR